MLTASFFTYAGPGRRSASPAGRAHPPGYRVYRPLNPTREWMRLPRRRSIRRTGSSWRRSIPAMCSTTSPAWPIRTSRCYCAEKSRRSGGVFTGAISGPFHAIDGDATAVPEGYVNIRLTDRRDAQVIEIEDGGQVWDQYSGWVTGSPPTAARTIATAGSPALSSRRLDQTARL